MVRSAAFKAIKMFILSIVTSGFERGNVVLFIASVFIDVDECKDGTHQCRIYLDMWDYKRQLSLCVQEGAGLKDLRALFNSVNSSYWVNKTVNIITHYQLD